MTMYIFRFLVLTMFHIAQINGQCRPAQVQSLILYDDQVLSWNRNEYETCTIDHYMITTSSEPDWIIETFITDQTIIHVGHLPDCADTWFRVTAISTDNIEGDMAMLYAKTPAPPDADLDLTLFSLSSVGDGSGVTLKWSIDDDWSKCIKRFRVVRYNEDDDDTESVYVYYGSEYTFDVTACTQYVFTATALYNLEQEGHVSVLRYTAPTFKIPSPEVTGFIAGSTTIDLTVNFPGAGVNRCPVNALIVDSSPYFNVSYPITGQNQINRPAMSVRMTNLLSDTLYWFRLSANNTAGPSDPYVIGIQTLPN